MPCSITDGPQFEDSLGPDEPEDEDAAYERVRQQETDDRNHAMETAAAEIDRDICRRNVMGRARWLHRMRDAPRGRTFSDPRNQEQRDLGVELEWRLRVLRNEAARP